MSFAGEQHPRCFMGPRAEGSVVERAIGAKDFLQRGSDDQRLAISSTFQHRACFTTLDYTIPIMPAGLMINFIKP